MNQNPQFRCMSTAREGQWLYQFGEEGIIYSEAQNRIAGLDAAGVLAYQAFDAGASLHHLQMVGDAGPGSFAAEQALNTIFALSQGRFPETQESEERRDWPALFSAPCANVEVHGIPMLVECDEALSVLCMDPFLSCPASTQPARFHLQVHRSGTTLAISVNGRDIFFLVRDEQIGLGMLHAVRSLLYAEAPYDAAFHGAMLAGAQHGVMLCGPREFGKSTLAAYLAAHGFRLVSDEPSLLHLQTASISPSASISPIEMPVSLKEGTWSILEGDWPQLIDAPVHVRSDGRRIKLLHPSRNHAAHAPQPLTHIVFPKYSPSSPARLEELSPIRRITLLNEAGMLLGKQLNKDKFEQLLTLICATPAFTAHYPSLQAASQILQQILHSDHPCRA